MRRIEVHCDIPGCSSTTAQDDRAGALEGWLRREVRDAVKKRMAEGVRDFSARVVLHVCPLHLPEALELDPVPTHPEVIEFLDQQDARDGTGAGPVVQFDPDYTKSIPTLDVEPPASEPDYAYVGDEEPALREGEPSDEH